jgi:hypothetical protein
MQRAVVAPGEVAPAPFDASGCLHGFPGLQLLDSLAVDSAGNICVATLVNGGISVVSPEGELVDFVPLDDMLTTNICFGGDDLTTAYVTVEHRARCEPTGRPEPRCTTNVEPGRALQRHAGGADCGGRWRQRRWSSSTVRSGAGEMRGGRSPPTAKSPSCRDRPRSVMTGPPASPSSRRRSCSGGRWRPPSEAKCSGQLRAEQTSAQRPPDG